MEQEVLKQLGEVAPYGSYGSFLLLIIYVLMDSKGILPWKKKNGNGYDNLLNNHIAHVKDDVEKIYVALEKRAPYDFVEGKIKELKEEQNRNLDKLEDHIDTRFDDIGKRIDNLEKI